MSPAPVIPNSKYSVSNFVSVFAMLSCFGEMLGFRISDPEELENIIECAEGHSKLKDLSLVLVSAATDRKTKASEGQWPNLCNALAAKTSDILQNLEVPDVVAESLDVYVRQDAEVHVDVLYWLCEAAVVSSSVIRSKINKEIEKARRGSPAVTPGVLRVLPYAEIAKHRYWLIGGRTQWLYCENLSQRAFGKFELLARSSEEFEKVAEDLKSSRLGVSKELAGRIMKDIVPAARAEEKRKKKWEKTMRKYALELASVHVYSERTRKRQRVNYNVDEVLDGIEY